MHRLFVFFQISLLCKSSRAVVAFEGLGLDVFTEVVSNVTTLIEYLGAVIELTSIILFVLIRIIIKDFDYLNHVGRNSLKFVFYVPSNDAVLSLHLLSIKMEEVDDLLVYLMFLISSCCRSVFLL
jgi:hypothetical protein